MSTLTERVARIADPSLWQLLDHETLGGVSPQDSMAARQREQSLARASDILREVRAAMREHFRGDPRLIEGIVGDFARHHGLDPPPAEDQQP